MHRVAFFVVAAVLVGGCGGPRFPAELSSEDEQARAAALEQVAGQEQELKGPELELALWNVARGDPNEFLRAKALERLYSIRPLSEPPSGVRMALHSALRDDPDLNRRNAALLQLHLYGEESLQDAADAYRRSRNPKTHRALLVGAAEMMSAEALERFWKDQKDERRKFAARAIAIQRKMRAGKFY